MVLAGKVHDGETMTITAGEDGACSTAPRRRRRFSYPGEASMALIRSFTRKHMERNSLHDEIEATYTTFERDGRVFI